MPRHHSLHTCTNRDLLFPNFPSFPQFSRVSIKSYNQAAILTAGFHSLDILIRRVSRSIWFSPRKVFTAPGLWCWTWWVNNPSGAPLNQQSPVTVVEKSMWGRMTPIKEGSTCLDHLCYPIKVGIFQIIWAKGAAVRSHLHEFRVASLLPCIITDTGVAAVENP